MAEAMIPKTNRGLARDYQTLLGQKLILQHVLNVLPPVAHELKITL